MRVRLRPGIAMICSLTIWYVCMLGHDAPRLLTSDLSACAAMLPQSMQVELVKPRRHWAFSTKLVSFTAKIALPPPCASQDAHRKLGGKLLHDLQA